MITIPHSRPTIGKREQEQVARTIATGQIAQGRMVKEFEARFARDMGVNHSAAVNSGTSAIHLALLALGVGEEAEVIVPSYVCTALLNAIHHAGARPVLADIDPVTFNIDPVDAEKRVTARTRAIIVPHLFGLPANLEALLNLGIPVIEDCAQSAGAESQNKKTGALGTVSIFSFYATKMMTTGEGGMVVSRDAGLIDGIKELREYDNPEGFKIRYNYKMTDIQAAMGLVQLKRLDSFIEKRRTIADEYREGLKGLHVRLPENHPGHVYYRYVIDLGFESSGLIRSLAQKGITATKPVYKPLHRYLNLSGYPNTERAWKKSISIPIYPSLSSPERARIIQAFKESFREEPIEPVE